MKLLPVPLAAAVAFARRLPGSRAALHRRQWRPALPAATAATPAEADCFVAAVNQEIRDNYVESTAAQWISETYINADSEAVVSKANERGLARLSAAVEKSRRYDHAPGVSPATQRGIDLLGQQTAPARAQGSEEAGRADRDRLAPQCRLRRRQELPRCGQAGDLLQPEPASDVLAKNRDWDADLEARTAWHDVARGMRKDYVRFAELANEGARATWVSPTPAHVARRLRHGRQRIPRRDRPPVGPGEAALHATAVLRPRQARSEVRCEDAQGWHHTRAHHRQYVGTGLVRAVPAAAALRGVSNLDVDAALEAQGRQAWPLRWPRRARRPRASADAAAIVAAQRAGDLELAKSFARRAEDFYTLDRLPRPRPPGSTPIRSSCVRATATWCATPAPGISTCRATCASRCASPPTRTTSARSTTRWVTSHYYLAYNPLPPLFQTGAHDGFHEAIGDTIQLNLTPAYLHTIEPGRQRQAGPARG